MDAESELDNELRNNYNTAGKDVGYWGRYFLRSLNNNGAVKTLKKMLISTSDQQVSKGFQALVDAGRLDLSIEATATDPRFSSLFTKQEIEEANRRLQRHKDILKPKRVALGELFPDELDDGHQYTEGACKTVIVNRYERDPVARADCLKKYGYKCRVCGLSFEKIYGELGRHFIHVHHIKPLATRRREYEVKPRIDLIPVCPNCHAMLHAETPPLSVDKLRAIMKKAEKHSGV